MKRARRALLLGIAVALLGACGGGLRSRAAPLVSYVLHAPAAEAVAAKTTPAIRKPLDYAVTVLPPAVEPGLADDGVALVTGDSRLDRFAASRWPDTVPRLVSALAVRTLRNSGAIATINDAAAPFTADFLLRINVSNFEAHYTGAHADGAEAPVVQVRFECAIARRSDRTVIASFIAESSETASENRMGGVIAAFDRATQSALTQLRRQTLQTLAAQAARTP